MTPLTLFMTCGPVGSGKSTYVAALLGQKTLSLSALISPDLLRLELSGDVSDQSKNGFIFDKLIPIRMTGARALHQCIVYDATNTTHKARKSIIEHAKYLGYQVEAHVFRVPIDVCKARNAARARVVPEFVIDRQFAQWQDPTLEEGIDRIVEVPFVP